MNNSVLYKITLTGCSSDTRRQLLREQRQKGNRLVFHHNRLEWATCFDGIFEAIERFANDPCFSHVRLDIIGWKFSEAQKTSIHTKCMDSGFVFDDIHNVISATG